MTRDSQIFIIFLFQFPIILVFNKTNYDLVISVEQNYSPVSQQYIITMSILSDVDYMVSIIMLFF